MAYIDLPLSNYICFLSEPLEGPARPSLENPLLLLIQSADTWIEQDAAQTIMPKHAQISLKCGVCGIW